jgi:hypothetical protein
VASINGVSYRVENGVVMGKAWRKDFHILLARGGRIFSEVESCTYRMWNTVFISPLNKKIVGSQTGREKAV